MAENFVANDLSPTVVSDQACFEECMPSEDSSEMPTPASMSATATTSSEASASTTSPPAPVCSDGVRVVVPPPDGKICQQRGLLFPTDRDFDDVTEFAPGGGLATSELDCVSQCLFLQWDCESFQFNPDTGACSLFFRTAEQENFVADDMSLFIVSDQMCFEYC